MSWGWWIHSHVEGQLCNAFDRSRHYAVEVDHSNDSEFIVYENIVCAKVSVREGEVAILLRLAVKLHQFWEELGHFEGE